jgi:hypothetical protein
MPKHETDSIWGVQLLLPKRSVSVLRSLPKQKTISMEKLSKHGERLATEIEASGTVYQIKRRTGRNMVLLDSRYLESLEHTLEFMRSHPNWEAEFEQGERDVAAGKYITLEELEKKYGLDADGHPETESGEAARGASKRRKRKNSRRTARTRARAS